MQRRGHQTRRVPRAGLWLVWILFLPAFRVRAQERALEFHIPAMDAASALTEFSTQSGTQMLFDFNVVQGARTARLEGRHTIRDALGILLAGSGLTFRAVNEITVSVVRDTPVA